MTKKPNAPMTPEVRKMHEALVPEEPVQPEVAPVAVAIDVPSTARISEHSPGTTRIDY